jgi:large subunit ribosomal protein L22
VAANETKQEVKAEARWVRISPRKARLVAEHIRGRTVPEARTVLAFTDRAAAREIEKVLKSAVSNAEANHGLIGDDLLVSAAYVDEGPTIKRWRARARGRIARIRKRTCHITVLLRPSDTGGLEEQKPRRRRQTEAKPKATAKDMPQKQKASAAEKPKPRRATRQKKTKEAGA